MTRSSADSFVHLTAYFPYPVFIFGEFQEGHSWPGRWEPKARVHEVLEVARKVKEAGGFFYLDGLKHEYVDTGRTQCLLVRDWINPYGLAKSGAGVAVASGAQPAAPAPELYVPVTRKVSLTPETATRIAS